jgi:hypothetical protein
MSGRIGERYNQANYLLAMDPPGTLSVLYYNTSNGSNPFYDFSGKAMFTRSFVVANTPTDNVDLSSTAHESFVVKVDSVSIADTFTLHSIFQEKIKLFLTGQQNICSKNNVCNYFNLNNNRSNGLSDTQQSIDPKLQQDHNGLISASNLSADINYLANKEADGSHFLLGNNSGNTINPNGNIYNTNRQYGRGGNDVFFGYDIGNLSTSYIMDFTDSYDQVSLESMKYDLDGNIVGNSRYWIDDNGASKTVRRKTCSNLVQCQGSGWINNGNDHANVSVEGARVGVVNITTLNKALDPNIKDTSVFVIR